jgi:hypothetical protein
MLPACRYTGWPAIFYVYSASLPEVVYARTLSIQQTCDYKGISFLKFLLSKERDIDKFWFIRKVCT